MKHAVAAVLICGLASMSAVGHCESPPLAAASSPETLMLLGTAGGPGGKKDRSGIASLLTVNGSRYLIDAGAGVTRQIAAAGLRDTDIDAVFITHLHDDHTASLPAWMTFAYTEQLNEAPKKTFTIYGPPHIDRYVAAADRLLDVNADIRSAEQHDATRPAAIFRANVMKAGIVFKDRNITVTALANTHFHLAGSAAADNRSYSLRVQTPSRVIVFTGDTGPSEELAAFARGADILVSEMVTRKLPPNAPASAVLHIQQEHLSPVQVGKLAAAAGVKTLVLSHINLVTPQHVAAIAGAFKGPIVVGADLMTF
ncbi:MAG: MBL fold metallo-hydrolase [Sphingomonadales bacterium]|nr:MBL fold metallo-hydrolase [Sphingomonadales bacterium]MDE2172163.1 MBL fold metallo-hydrolase [Sphingomonadales bacterium]